MEDSATFPRSVSHLRPGGVVIYTGISPEEFPVSHSALSRLCIRLITPDDVPMFFRKKAPKVVPPPEPVAPPPPPPEPEDDGTPRKKILVVDDDPVILKTLSYTLQSKGFKVVTATDGSQAIGMMRDEEPDMMVVDVTLPPDVGAGGVVPWDGFQVTQWIRRMNGKVPTIVISGADRQDYKDRAKALGAEFLSKPINNDALVASIASALAPQQGTVNIAAVR